MLNLAMGVLKKHNKIDDGDRHFHVVVVHAEMHITDIGYSWSFQVIGALLPHDDFGVWKPFIFFLRELHTKWEVTKTCRALKHGTCTPIHTTMSAICMKAHNDIKWSTTTNMPEQDPTVFSTTPAADPSTFPFHPAYCQILAHHGVGSQYVARSLPHVLNFPWKNVSGCIII